MESNGAVTRVSIKKLLIKSASYFHFFYDIIIDTIRMSIPVSNGSSSRPVRIFNDCSEGHAYTSKMYCILQLHPAIVLCSVGRLMPRCLQRGC